MENIDERVEKTNLEYMLEFETQLFLDLIHNDGLVVAAKGLSLELVILNILKVYCDPGNLVLVLNANENEEKYYKEKLNDRNVHTTSFTTSTEERMDTYLSGGIHFVTTRILVVDMLKKRVPIDKITGIVVLRAHAIFESCQEGFVLRLYRQGNKTGFIKAFSNSVQSFTVGFGQVERVMRALFIKELYIWPRFHSLVIQSLKKYEPQVIELHIPISEKIRKMQTYILEIMNSTVKELKRINKTVELQEITVENCVTKKFHKILQAQLDSIWHQLSSKSKQLIADLKTLRHLIITLLYSDPVSFYSLVTSYRSMEYAQSSTWVLLEPSEMLFMQVNSLIYSGDKEFNPEFCPKWKSLLELLQVEIPNDIKATKKDDHKILVLCSDNRTCFQLNEVLTKGPYEFLYNLAIKKGLAIKSINPKFRLSLNKETNQISSSKSPKKPKLDEPTTSNESTKTEDEEECLKSSYLLTMSQTFNEKQDISLNESQFVFEPCSQMENIDFTQICESLTKPTVLVQTFKGGAMYTSLQQTLHNLKPSYVVMYNSDVNAVREIEMYEAHRQKDTKLKVYFLIHTETVEEQSYLTALRREKEAFEYLIKTKSTMVIPEDQDGKSETCLALHNQSFEVEKNTRQGGVEQIVKKGMVIVDMREFRSELPSLIHKRGIDIEPVTITVGDYIITSEICIERKSLSDLIGSLNSGRLFQQCTQMSRYYTKPMLLIEFDQNKPFSWQNHYMLSTDGNNFDVQKKLLLLTLHFPKLKIIWSPSPYASAQLIEELKQGKKDPDLEFAVSIGGEDLDLIETKYNSGIYDAVQKMPGINSKNIDGFLRRGKNLDEIIKKSEEELKELVGNSVDAKALYSIIHEEHLQKENSEDLNKPKKPKYRKFLKK